MLERSAMLCAVTLASLAGLGPWAVSREPWASSLGAQDGAASTTAAGSSAAFSVVAFRIIVVSSVDRAEQLAARIRRGEEFADLARTESIDPSAARGGLIGPISPAELRAELSQALREMPVGSVKGGLAVPTGYALVQRVAADAASLAAADSGAALSAASGIKPLISVDGVIEVQTALGNLEKPAGWNLEPGLICEFRQRGIARVEGALSRILAPGAERLRAGYDPKDLIDAHVTLGQLRAFTGDMQRAVSEYQEAHRLAAEHNPATLPDHQQALAVVHIHKAEMDNGIYADPADRCLLPAQPGPPLTKNADFAAGERLLLSLLDGSSGNLEARWLLNAAHMATGGYPSRVPPQHLIDPAAFASSEDAGHFVDVAAASGVRSLSMAGGVVVDDFDNDGRMDILTSNADHCGSLQLFRRADNGMFVDRTAAAGLSGQLGGLNLNHADYNNDRCVDALVMRGGWELGQRRSLLRNNCDGTFSDVTAAAGLQAPVTSSQTAVWTDIDNDGWVDLFVGNEDAPAQLFRNRGDGTFTDIAAAAGVQRSAFTKGVTAADYDNDGFADLFVSNFRGASFLYHNNGDRTFTEAAAAAGVRGADRGFAAWFFDYDNDGWQDLFATSYVVSIDETARSYLGLPLNGSTMKLYRNLGNGRFGDVTRRAGLAKSLMTMGSNFGDIDNDGFLDIYLGTGSPSYVSLVPSMLLRNRGGESFADVTMSSGTGEMHKGHGVAFADLDADGDEEIVFKVGGATPGDAHAFRLFENPGHGNDWLGVRLVGVRSNRSAIGSRITVTVEGSDGARRSIRRTVTSGGSFGSSPFEQHVGLGKATRIVGVDVEWPASGTRQSFTGVTKNQVIEVREMAASYTAVVRPALPLGSRRARP